MTAMRHAHDVRGSGGDAALVATEVVLHKADKV